MQAQPRILSVILPGLLHVDKSSLPQEPLELLAEISAEEGAKAASTLSPRALSMRILIVFGECNTVTQERLLLDIVSLFMVEVCSVHCAAFFAN